MKTQERQILQNKALQRIYWCDKTSSTMEMHNKSNLLPLQKLRDINLAATTHPMKLGFYTLKPTLNCSLNSSQHASIEKPKSMNTKFEQLLYLII